VKIEEKVVRGARRVAFYQENKFTHGTGKRRAEKVCGLIRDCSGKGRGRAGTDGKEDVSFGGRTFSAKRR